MTKKYKYLQVHTLHYTLVDEEGNDNGKVYEYDGDHSLFCDGIDFNEANGYKQQAASCKRQASSLTRKNYYVMGESRRKKYD